MTSKYAGYMGKVIMVDLSTETVSEYPWSDEQRELYLGGKIMAARILCDHLTGRETAFSEENWVVLHRTADGNRCPQLCPVQHFCPVPPDRDSGLLQLRRQLWLPSEESRLRRADSEGKMPGPQVAGDQRGSVYLPRCR